MSDVSAANPNPTAAEVERAWTDVKLANVLYHDWEATTYDEKWSISYDQRCIDYARDRFIAVAGSSGWPYAVNSQRLGSPSAYCRTTDRFELPRLSYPDAQRKQS